MFKYLPLLLMFVNFSPVIPGSYIRPQHLVVYPVFAWVALITMRRDLFSLQIKELRRIALIFFLMIFWGGISSIIMKSFGFWNLTGILSAIDSLLFPVAVISVVSFYINVFQVSFGKELIIKCMNVYIVLMIINGLLVVVHVVTGISWWFDYFVDKDSEIVVAETSLSMGRYTGVFNQPFEAGLAASFGLFLVFYRVKYFQKIHLLDWVGCVSLPLVGILAVSKAFFLICPPLLLFYLIHMNRNWVKHFLAFLFFTIFGLLIFFPLLMTKWDGVDFMRRYFTAEIISENRNASIQRFTAGRYADDSSVKEKVLYLISNHPVFGFGMSWRQGEGNNVFGGAVDNAYLQALIYGGIPNLALYLLLLWTMFNIAYAHRKVSPLESSFLLFFTLYIFLAGNGAPCFPQHKFTVAFFTIFTLLVHIMVKQEARYHSGGIPEIDMAPSHSRIMYGNRYDSRQR